MVLLITNYLPLKGNAQALCPQNQKEAYYLNTGTYPKGDVYFGKDLLEVQGITHDDAPKPNWYITSTHHSTQKYYGTITAISKVLKNAFLFKIPVTEDLQTIDVFHSSRVKYTSMFNYTELWNPNTHIAVHNRIRSGYIHWGDPDHYTFNKVEYLIVPVTSPSNRPNNLGWGSPAVVIFRASNLSIVAYGLLPNANGKGQKDVSWCAVNPKTGYLYTSEDRTQGIIKYKIPWNLLPASGYKGKIAITYEQSYKLKDRNNNNLDLHNMAGGEFTPSGELLYIVNGGGHCKFGGVDDPGQPTDGIHVFDTILHISPTGGQPGWKEIRRSTNRMYLRPGESNCCKPYTDYFDFTYDFGCGTFEVYTQQPEGLTIFDIDKVKNHNPNVSGQLHVVLVNVGANIGGRHGDEARIDHYSNKIYVDAVNGSSPSWPTHPGNSVNQFFNPDPFSGTKQKPFKNVKDAVYFYPAWDGSLVYLKTPDNPKPSIMAIQPLVVYQVTNVPTTRRQGQLLPNLKIILYNNTSVKISKQIGINFLLSHDPITPAINKTHNYSSIGTLYKNVYIKPFGSKTYYFSGLYASSPPGHYYLGTSVDCGPISSPGNPVFINILPNTGKSVYENEQDTTYDLKSDDELPIDDSLEIIQESIPDSSTKIEPIDSTVTLDHNVVEMMQNDINGNSVSVNKRNEVKPSTELNVFPNPASGVLNIRFKSKSGTKYVLSFFDAVGRLILVRQGLANQGVNLVNLDVGGLIKGPYILNISLDNINSTTKVIIQ